MALLDPKSYFKNVLVVGDDKFSFTVCLASVLSKTYVKFAAISLDSRAALPSNDFAVENIEKLSSFENIEILHELDPTDLRQTFGSRTIDRVAGTGGIFLLNPRRELGTTSMVSRLFSCLILLTKC